MDHQRLHALVEPGTHVVFDRTHHLHNRELKRHRGHHGVVRVIGTDGKVLVRFRDSHREFWIAPKYLVIAEG